MITSTGAPLPVATSDRASSETSPGDPLVEGGSLDRHRLLVAHGALDTATACHLRAQLEDDYRRTAHVGAPRLVLDLTAVGTVDMNGLGVIVGTARRAREANGCLHLVVSEPVVRLLNDSGLWRILSPHLTTAAATAHCRARPPAGVQ